MKMSGWMPPPCSSHQVSDYLEVITQPMDLSTIMTKIDTQRYLTVKDFLADIDLICSNALEYNPDKDPGGKHSDCPGYFHPKPSACCSMLSPPCSFAQRLGIK